MLTWGTAGIDCDAGLLDQGPISMGINFFEWLVLGWVGGKRIRKRVEQGGGGGETNGVEAVLTVGRRLLTEIRAGFTGGQSDQVGNSGEVSSE